MSLTRDAVLAALRGSARGPVSEKTLLRRLGLHREQARFLRSWLQRLVADGSVLGGRQGFRLQTTRAARPAAADRAEAAGGAGRPERPKAARRQPVPRAEAPEKLPPREDWVGILSRDSRGSRAVVTPYRDDARWRVEIDRDGVGSATDGDVVRVAPLARAARPRASRAAQQNARGRVVEVLGRPGEPEADFQAIIWRHRLPVAFPPDALAEADALAGAPGAADRAGRLDLRDKPFLTIDPATARDHDDAVCVEPLPGGATRLWVAIADVAHHVAEGSALDREALRRGNSVYFPDRAIPMLPERLSGDVCSLRPGVERLTMAVSLDLARDGSLLAKAFHAALIRSRARLVYDDAAQVMEGGAPPPGWSAEVVAQLRALHAVSSALLRARFAAGSLDFDLPSAEIVLGDDGHPVDIIEAPRTVAHRAVEEAMLAANRAVAEALGAAQTPALYRIHEPPDPEKMAGLEDVLERFGLLPAGVRGARKPREIASALQRAEGRPEARLVNLVALRSMKQARYHPEDRGHFALAFRHYTHFTSPIRRYADLVVHRALKGLLAGGVPAARAAAARAERVHEIGNRVSWLERAAMEAEREMIAMKKCGFLAAHVGEICAGTITGVTAFGLFVTLDPWFADGLVHVSRLPERMHFDERSFSLHAARSGRRFALGDALRVRIDRVDLIKAWVELSLVEDAPARRKPPAAAAGRRQPKASSRTSSSAARRSHSR